MTAAGKRILIATIGSLGDLHPCLALASELMRRGHRITLATTPHYRQKVESLGIHFTPLRPDWDPTNPEMIRRCEDLKKGPEVLYREMVLPHLRDMYADLLAAARDADLMLAAELVYAAPLVAEKLALPWVSLVLSPFCLFSACDPSVMVNAPSLIHLRKAGAWAYRAGINLGRLATRHWSNPVRALRRDEGLNPRCDPIFRDKFSPHLVLAMFSPWLAEPQPDWPPNTVTPGFAFYGGGGAPAPELSAFLDAGEPPIVFTQGSTAVHNPGRFFEVSAAAAKRLGRRALLLGTTEASPDPDILALPYASYAHVFPRGAINVHQGGSGTTGEALRASRPMLVVPYGWDQPDNAARITRLGTGLQIPRAEYSIDTATAALKTLLENPNFAARATHVGEQMAHERGLESACDAVERVNIYQ